uniref:Uncharacterized protein n=1 Tax=Avena sativa TaxID=4498 RepID=A0ACD5V9W3_AVESA
MAEHGRRAADHCWKVTKSAVIADTCVPMFQLPCLCAWHCLCCRYAKAGKDASLCAWQCVQFWTPLSLTVFFLWLLYRPDRFYPTVDSAVLTALRVTTGKSSLEYDLAANLTLRNSNARLAIRYLDVGVAAFYDGTRLGSADNSLPGSFRQGPKNTTVLRPSFRGEVAGVEEGVVKELDRERAAGTVHVRVSVDLTIMYKVWFVEEVFFYRYDCWLWFTPPPNAVFHGDGAPCLRV